MENNCGICLDEKAVNDYQILPCTHKICILCYPKLLKRECPYCRTPFHQEKHKDENTIQDITFHYSHDYELLEQRSYERLERRRERRQKRREKKQNRQRRINIQQPIEIFQLDDNDDENKENIKPTNMRYKNHKKSERWNNLRNQRSILNF